MLCAIALFAIASLGGEEVDSNSGTTRHRIQMLQIIILLTGSLAVISLISINKPYIALFWFLVWLLVWLLLAARHIYTLFPDSNQSGLPTTSNVESNSN
ncbi:hypothetical protein SLA2020_215580 [Shorea laevis]